MPTENYGLFALSQELGKSVCELLTGAPGPLSAMEQYMWQRWKLARLRLSQQSRPGKRHS